MKIASLVVCEAEKEIANLFTMSWVPIYDHTSSFIRLN